MTDKKPTSFRIFCVVLAINALVFLTAVLFSYFGIDKKYAMLLALFMFVSFAFSTVGIYSGFKFRAETKRDILYNRIGTIGSILIFLFVLAVMTTAALSMAR